MGKFTFAFKNDPGKYQAIEAKDIPDIALDEHGSHLRVIAGEYADAKGAASTFSPLNVWDGKLVKAKNIPCMYLKGILPLLLC